MSAVPTQSSNNAFDAAGRLQELRLRLVEATADLRPLPAVDDLAPLVQAVVAQLEEIVQDLRLIVHVSQLEDRGVQEQLAEVDKRLADGWIPESSTVTDVVARLRVSLQDR